MKKTLVLSIALSALASLSAHAADFNTALACPADMKPWMSCGEYKAAADQHTFIRLCEKKLDNGNILPSFVIATKLSDTDYETSESADFAKFDDNSGSVIFNVAHQQPADGESVQYNEYSFRPAGNNQPYTHEVGVLAHTASKKGNVTSDVGVRVADYQFNCWAE